MRRKLKRFLKRKVDDLVHRLATANIQDGASRENEMRLEFIARCREMKNPVVLELGTKRSNPNVSTRHDDWVPGARYLGTDLAEGLDVDLVADVHRLTQVTGSERFDAIISCSTFEHLKYPHVAAHELMKALRVGGVLYVQTHQSFPLHAYPYDYFRFSREGLAGAFGTRMGFRVLACEYEFPVKLYSPRDAGHTNFPAFLNVCLYGEKIAATPAEYVYEYDVTS
jgi:hypothetical protein